MNNWNKTTVLITGGSSGLGLEMARQMLSEGAEVIICGRSKVKLDDAKNKLPKVHTVPCDITLAEDRERLKALISKDFSNLNLLVNNAGIARRYLFTETGDLTQRLTEEWQTNYFAPVLLSQIFLPLLIKNRGTIVNVSSGLAYLPLIIEPNYCATKAALHSMTQSMRIQCKKVGVKVIEIFYPEVDTPLNEGHATKNALKPEEAVREALALLNLGKEEIRVKRSKMLYLLSRLIPVKSVNKINDLIGKEIENRLTER